MEKTLRELLSALPENSLSYTFTLADGSPSGMPQSADKIRITSLEFDSRHVTAGSLFFALPGTHTTGNRFIAEALSRGAVCVVYQDTLTPGEKEDIMRAASLSSSETALIRVDSSRFAMSPISAAFYDNPSEHLVVYGVTGTEGKSSTVSFIWQLLRLCGYRAGFISTVQYSLGGDAVANPEHQTTPEATIVQKELHQMLLNGCTHAVVESSSHGLSGRTNRLGDVRFDCAVFMNVTLEHLEFHGTLEQYKSDKANLFRALDKWPHEKLLLNDGKDAARREIPSFGVVSLEDPAAPYFISATQKRTVGFTTCGMAGKRASGSQSGNPLPPVPQGVPYVSASGISSTLSGTSFSMRCSDGPAFNEDNDTCMLIDTRLPGAFNAYNVMAAMLAVSGTTGIPLHRLAPLAPSLSPVKGRMTAIDQGQPFEVIVDYAHTPSSFETIFPPVRSRCKGRIISLFGSGGERDVTKRPLQGEIAARFSDIIVLTDEDPRGEDSTMLLEQIAGGRNKGARGMGKTDGESLFIIPDRPAAIRMAFSLARAGDIVLLLGKSHENSIIYKDRVMPYDEISEAQKALSEMGFAP